MLLNSLSISLVHWASTGREVPCPVVGLLYWYHSFRPVGIDKTSSNSRHTLWYHSNKTTLTNEKIGANSMQLVYSFTQGLSGGRKAPHNFRLSALHPGHAIVRIKDGPSRRLIYVRRTFHIALQSVCTAKSSLRNHRRFGPQRSSRFCAVNLVNLADSLSRQRESILRMSYLLTQWSVNYQLQPWLSSIREMASSATGSLLKAKQHLLFRTLNSWSTRQSLGFGFTTQEMQSAPVFLVFPSCNAVGGTVDGQGCWGS